MCPRSISSCNFVISRQTAALRSPIVACRSSRELNNLWGDSKKTSVAFKPANDWNNRRLGPPEAGGKAWNKKVCRGNPDKMRAAMIAEGPGIYSTLIPRSMTLGISCCPGSDKPGVPASETNAIDFPSVSHPTTRGIICDSRRRSRQSMRVEI